MNLSKYLPSLFYWLMLLLIILNGCVAPPPPVAFDVPTGTPIPTPTPRSELGSLPRNGWVRINPRLKMPVWEFPGLPAMDSSDTGGMRGREVGQLPFGTEVEVLQYQWSDEDKTYYLYVRYGEIEGWADDFSVVFQNPNQ